MSNMTNLISIDSFECVEFIETKFAFFGQVYDALQPFKLMAEIFPSGDYDR
jgi:hypothetical protein